MRRDVEKTAKGVAEMMAAEGADTKVVYGLVKSALEDALASTDKVAEILGEKGTAVVSRWWVQCDPAVRSKNGQNGEDSQHDYGVVAREPISSGPRRTPIRVGGCTHIPLTRCYWCYEIDLDPGL